MTSKRKGLVPTTLGLLLTLLFASVLFGLLNRPTTLRTYRPEGFVDRANQFIIEGNLVAQCSVNADSLLVSSPLLPTDSAWYFDSYLADDVEEYNRDSQRESWRFVVDENCRLLGVNPTVHRIRLPFSDASDWNGTAYYSGDASGPVLRSPGRTLAFSLRPRDVPFNERPIVTACGSATVQAASRLELAFQGAGDLRALEVAHGGDALTVENRGGAQVLLSGTDIPEGRRFRLDEGDWLTVSQGDCAEVFTYTGGGQLPIASGIRLRNGQRVRFYEDIGLGEYRDTGSPRATSFVENLAQGLTILSPQGTPLEADVHLTFEYELQRNLSREFYSALNRIYEGPRNIAPLTVAALTVMDARTGAVLAMPTYPSSSQLGDGDDIRLVRNHNLTGHPIGSAGKPFFFAAIGHLHPWLLDLVIGAETENGEVHNVFQCRLSEPYAAHITGDSLDFSSALARSSNQYTVELATLALAAEGGVATGPLLGRIPEEVGLGGQLTGPRIGNERLTWAPHLSRFVRYEGADQSPLCDQMSGLGETRLVQTFEDLTGTSPWVGRDPQSDGAVDTDDELQRRYRTAQFDPSVWKPLTDSLTSARGLEGLTTWQINAPLQGLSPERTNLAFNLVSTFRGHFVSRLLGGAASRWTNVQLAEAMSRLVTNRGVTARFVYSGSARIPNAAPPLELDERAHRATLQGMKGVVESSLGTARALQSALIRLRAQFPGDGVWLLSKTGSPTVEVPVANQTGEVLQRLVASRVIRFEGDQLEIPASGRSTPYAPNPSDERQDWVDRVFEVAGDPNIGSDLVAILDHLGSELARGIRGVEITGPLFTDELGLVTRREHEMFNSAIREHYGGVYALVLVRVPGAAARNSGVPTMDDLEHPESRILSAAAYVDGGESSAVAVELVGELLPVLAGWLGN